MARIIDILNFMRSFAPENATDPDFEDNVGLLVGTDAGNTEKCVLCLDATEDVVKLAKKIDAKLIISHHPVIFRNLSSINENSPTGRTILAAIRDGIAIYSSHTNLDFCEKGINDYVAKLLDLKNIIPMYTTNNVGIGRIGNFSKDILLKDLEVLAREKFNDDQIRVVGNENSLIRKVAIINGGAGQIEYIQIAKKLGADCYISGDFPHHALLYAREENICALCMQHFAMESVYMIELSRILSNNIKDIEFIVANDDSPTHKGA